nr:Uncharacterised protein [Streptococcus thermophilus]
MVKEQDKRPAFFATENLSDPLAAAGRQFREGEYAMFGRYSSLDGEEGPVCSQDFDREIAGLCTYTGLRRAPAEKAVVAYMSLRDLPRLRALQHQSKLLDIDRLDAIALRLAELGPNATEEVYSTVDELLVSLFTPTRMNQPLPTRATITRRLRELIAELDSEVAYNEKKRKKREEKDPPPPGECEISFREAMAGTGTAGLTLIGDNATIAATKASIDETARTHGLTQSDAALKLLNGDITPAPGAKIYAYTPLTEDGELNPAAPAYFPGFGWTTASGTEMFNHMLSNGEKNSVKVVNLDESAARTVNSYSPPEDIKAYVRGRDGTCRFPGCTVSAWKCQIDHRVPFGLGGETTASNLFSLCAHHHNMKTDRRVYYIPDPVTGELVWLFPDGTFQRTDPEGFIHSQVTPTAPKWQHSLEDILRLHRKKTRFFARGHKLIDDYEAGTSTLHECLTAIAGLEKEFGREFPFRPKDAPKEAPEEIPRESAEVCVEDAPPF